VNYKVAAGLNKVGHFRGDPLFEAAGVFEAATKPRVTAAITGLRPDGQRVEGAYLDGREYAEGFEENVEFFRLDYLDPVAVELGMHFDDLHPLMWLAAGGIGERKQMEQSARFALPSASPYAVLFDPSGMPGLLKALSDRPDVTHVFIVADSDRSFATLASSLPDYTVVQLYRRYLETLRGATS
jgi:adenine-specific DNA-methyltransferase